MEEINKGLTTSSKLIASKLKALHLKVQNYKMYYI